MQASNHSSERCSRGDKRPFEQQDTGGSDALCLAARPVRRKPYYQWQLDDIIQANSGRTKKLND